MTPIPASRGQLLAAPIALAALTFGTALLMLPMTGPTPVLWWLALPAALVLVLTAWVTLRSFYGVVPGLLVVALVTGVLVMVLSTASAAAITIAGWPQASPWVGASTLLVCGACLAWSIQRCWRLKVHRDPIFVAYLGGLIDHQRQRVAYQPEGGIVPVWPWASPWLIGALGVQLYAAASASGLEPRYLAPTAALLMLTGGFWLMSKLFGPGLGVALCLRAIEREAGQCWVHRDLEQLQALRRAWWVTRWLAPADPPQLATSRLAKGKRNAL